jgi:dimethylargininase
VCISTPYGWPRQEPVIQANSKGKNKLVKSENDRLKRVVVCTPRTEYGRARNQKEHNIGELGDPDAAIQQHDALKNKLQKFGTKVLDIPELTGHPNSVFTRDTALFTPQGYIKLNLGLETRQGEERWMADFLNSLGEQCAGEITAPGTVEGGDVVFAGNVAFIGNSIRTNEEGIRQFSEITANMGYEIRIIQLPDTILHLDKALMTLDAKRVLFCKEIISEKEIAGFEGVGISCGGSTTANIVCLGDGEFIVNETNDVVVDLLTDEGYRVHVLDLTEFAKGMGGPNCLIMPVERSVQ